MLPHSSAGKESACNAGASSSIPRSERSPGEGTGYPLQYSWASLVAQMVRNLPAMRETWVRSLSWDYLGWEDPWRRVWQPTPVKSFPGNSAGKEATCSAGDPGSIPGMGRFPKEGIGYLLQYSWAALVAQMVKNPPAMQGDLGLIPGLGRSPEEGNGYPLKYSCLENSMDRGVWQARVHGATKSWTQLRDFHFTRDSLQI